MLALKIKCHVRDSYTSFQISVGADTIHRSVAIWPCCKCIVIKFQNLYQGTPSCQRFLFNSLSHSVKMKEEKKDERNYFINTSFI